MSTQPAKDNSAKIVKKSGSKTAVFFGVIFPTICLLLMFSIFRDKIDAEQFFFLAPVLVYGFSLIVMCYLIVTSTAKVYRANKNLVKIHQEIFKTLNQKKF